MSSESQSEPITEQDRVLSDQLETFRHLMADPEVPKDRKRRASQRIKGVWRNLARLQDPNGFENHLSEHIQHEYQRRNNPENLDEPKRRKPLCSCDRSRHVCEAKAGEVPSKIRTRDYEFLDKPGTQELAREYVQEHSGDIVVREAMKSYRDLRADIYSELSAITTMLTGGPTQAERAERDDADGSRDSFASGVDYPTSDDATEQLPADGADDAEDVDVEAVVDQALASVVEREGAEALAEDATEGALNVAKILTAAEDGDVDVEDLKAVTNGEMDPSELAARVERADDAHGDTGGRDE